jgi:hypothetical protein
MTANPIAIGAATVVLGLFTPGGVPLMLGRIHEILPHSHVAQRAAWSRLTTAFALFQALGGYGYSFLFTHSGEDYGIVFLLGAVAVLAAFLVDAIAGMGRNRPPSW